MVKLIANYSKLIITSLSLLLSIQIYANGNDALYLFRNRQTTFSIVTSAKATASEKHAATVLRQYLQDISGARFTISTTPGTHTIFVGYNEPYMKSVGLQQMAASDDSFTYQTKNNNLYVYGGSARGTLYGIYALLENELGVRWFTPTCTVKPSLKAKLLSDIGSRTEHPAFLYRHLLAYPINISHQAMSLFRLNEADWLSKGGEKTEYGPMERYWGTHSLGESFITQKEYFASNPEYFSLWEGKRIANGQVCLSNPNVLKICIEKMKKVIQANPNRMVYEISQNDNRRYCTCKKCQRIEKKYGGHSGIMLWFVNQVAQAIAKDYPDKLIGTMAYQYTLEPPTGLQAEDNVVIRISTSGACFAHPLTNRCNDGEARSDIFMDALQGWSKICKHIYVWDYVANFIQYSAPFPNFDVLAANLRLFHQYGAMGVMEQGQRSSMGGEFAELKSWVLAKLMWNPDQDADSLATVFINGYYGKAAPQIGQYFNLVKQLSTPNQHLRCVFSQQQRLYSQDFINQGSALLKKAEKAVKGDSTMTSRVQMVKLQILSAKVLANPVNANTDGSWNEYKQLTRKFKVKPSELQDLEPFIKQTEQKIQKRKLGQTGLVSLPLVFLLIGFAIHRWNGRKEAEA